MLDINITWKGEAFNDGYDQNNKCIVKVDPKYYRPTKLIAY